jgi:hypothetical protein
MRAYSLRCWWTRKYRCCLAYVFDFQDMRLPVALCQARLTNPSYHLRGHSPQDRHGPYYR